MSGGFVGEEDVIGGVEVEGGLVEPYGGGVGAGAEVGVALGF